MLHSTHWRQHVALDVGTATTRMASGVSRRIDHPSCIGTRRALRGGVVVDGEAVTEILKPLLDRTRAFGIVKPCVLACAPSDARPEERQSLTDSVMRAGAAAVSLVPEPLAAAIGSGLDVSSPYGQMIIDIGEGVTDCAVIRSSRIQASCAIRIGCDRMRRSILLAAREYGCVHVDDSHADMLMRTCGVARSGGHAGSLMTAAAIQPVVDEIADTIDSFLRDLPDELGCEIIESGICLAGGGAMIPGVREFLERRTGIDVTLSGNPRASVVEGARAILPVVLLLNQWK